MDNTDLAKGATVVVVGSGAGGATAFRTLALAGVDVLLLEEGSDSSSPPGYHGRLSDLTARLYRQGGLTPVMGTPPFAFGEGRTLGGTTEINGGLFWRTPEWVLDDWSSRGGLGHLSPTLLEPVFADLERDLRSGPTRTLDGYDKDSELLTHGARSLGWNVVEAQRVVPDCSRSNQCGSGCATGAKQSMAMTYIPEGVRAGGRVAPDVRAISVRTSGVRATHVLAVTGDGSRIAIPCQEIIVSGGALQTPALLHRAGLSKAAGKRIGFHLNTKILARFDEEVDAHLGTMFTHQVQEFMRQGILIMAANYRPEYLSLAIAGWDNARIESLLAQYRKTAMYTMMVRPRSYGRLATTRRGTVPLFRLSAGDRQLLAQGTLRTAEALFAAGARSVNLPVREGLEVTTLDQAELALTAAKAMDWEVSSVHAMASCSMGTGHSDPVDPTGRLRGWQNVSVADASVLPSTVGESPQETVMAMSMLIARAVAERSNAL